MPGHVHALPNARVIGMLGRKVQLGNVIGEFNRDPDTDQHGHKIGSIENVTIDNRCGPRAGRCWVLTEIWCCCRPR
jgi:hypothetical protein